MKSKTRRRIANHLIIITIWALGLWMYTNEKYPPEKPWNPEAPAVSVVDVWRTG